ncbi:hypothetical protein MRX96_034963 [Rhipicephalus microplus]
MRTCWPLNYHMYCRTEVEQGPCQSWSVRYYFSAEKNHCFPFYYSGCGGNFEQLPFRTGMPSHLHCGVKTTELGIRALGNTPRSVVLCVL